MAACEAMELAVRRLGLAMSPILFDFDRPIGRPCQKCGYPFGNPPDRMIYPMRMNDCPEHMPPEWKYHERKASEIAREVDRVETILKEAVNAG